MSAQTDAVTREQERTQVGSLRHTLAVVWCGWRAALSGAAEYRGDLVVGTLVSLVWLGVSAVRSSMTRRSTVPPDLIMSPCRTESPLPIGSRMAFMH